MRNVGYVCPLVLAFVFVSSTANAQDSSLQDVVEMDAASADILAVDVANDDGSISDAGLVDVMADEAGPADTAGLDTVTTDLDAAVSDQQSVDAIASDSVITDAVAADLLSPDSTEAIDVGGIDVPAPDVNRADATSCVQTCVSEQVLHLCSAQGDLVVLNCPAATRCLVDSCVEQTAPVEEPTGCTCAGNSFANPAGFLCWLGGLVFIGRRRLRGALATPKKN